MYEEKAVHCNKISIYNSTFRVLPLDLRFKSGIVIDHKKTSNQQYLVIKSSRASGPYGLCTRELHCTRTCLLYLFDFSDNKNLNSEHLFNFSITGGGGENIDCQNKKQINVHGVRYRRGHEFGFLGREFIDRYVNYTTFRHHTTLAIYVLVRFHDALHKRIDYVLEGGGAASRNQSDVFGADKTNKQKSNSYFYPRPRKNKVHGREGNGKVLGIYLRRSPFGNTPL